MTIDFHTHVFPRRFRVDRAGLFPDEPGFSSIYRYPQAKLASTGGLIRDMDAEKIDRSVIFGFPWEDPEHYRRHNDYILESVTRYPDRLVGFCCFSPFAKGKAREAERCMNAGLSGVGEVAVYGRSLSARVVRELSPVMALCREWDAPFLLHTNEGVGHRYPGKAPMTLAQVYRFIKTYPSNRIVLAHWGAGLFFYNLMKREVGKVFNRVWVDTAASPYLYVPEIYRVGGEIFGYEKILFGSDYPLIKPERYFRELEKAGLTSQQIEQITDTNARELLGLHT